MHVKSKGIEEGAAAEGRPPEGTASATHERSGERPRSRKTEQSLQTRAALIADRPVEPLAHMLLGAIDEGAMLVARADDGGKTREAVGASVDRFLDALRPMK